MNSPESLRNDLINIVGYLFRESDRPRARLLLITIINRSGNADQRSIGAVQAQRIVNQVKLAPVFAGYHPAMRLIPIQNQLLLQTLADDIEVDGDFASIIEVQLINGRLLWLPAGTWQTVLRRMNTGAGPLAPEVSDKQPNLSLRTGEITAIEIIGHTQRVDGVLVQRPVGKHREPCDLGWKIGERLCRWRSFSVG